jgi:hypothetical protein
MTNNQYKLLYLYSPKNFKCVSFLNFIFCNTKNIYENNSYGGAVVDSESDNNDNKRRKIN